MNPTGVAAVSAITTTTTTTTNIATATTSSSSSISMYYYYDSTYLKGGGAMYCHKPSALVCDSVHSWQRGKFVTQHCNPRYTMLRRNHEMDLPSWKNHPGGDQKPPQCSFQCKHLWVPPTEADTEKAQEHRKYAIQSKCIRKRKKRDLRVKILKKNMKIIKRLQM
jgi:hypothetical protein